MLNSVTIHAIRKTSSLPTPLKTLLLSLAVSDLGVGVLVQPLFVARIVMGLEQNIGNPMYQRTDIAFLITVNVFAFASLFGVMALSGDRFLAIYLHLRYQELVTHKRVVAVVISIWVFSAILSLVQLWSPGNIYNVIRAIISTACAITTTCLSYKIHVAVRRHTHQIQAFQVQQAAQNGEMANVGRLRKSAVTIVYVYLVFLLCYFPKICIFWIVAITSEFESNIILDVVRRSTTTLLFLNSSLNPLIYCWKMRHIRHNIINIL